MSCPKRCLPLGFLEALQHGFSQRLVPPKMAMGTFLSEHRVQNRVHQESQIILGSSFIIKFTLNERPPRPWHGSLSRAQSVVEAMEVTVSAQLQEPCFAFALNLEVLLDVGRQTWRYIHAYMHTCIHAYIYIYTFIYLSIYLHLDSSEGSGGNFEEVFHPIQLST